MQLHRWQAADITREHSNIDKILEQITQAAKKQKTSLKLDNLREGQILLLNDLGYTVKPAVGAKEGYRINWGHP